MLRKIVQLSNLTRRSNVLGSLRLSSTTGTEKPPIIDVDGPELPLPMYPKKINEPLKQQKMRLIYQSRKRGMLENDLLLSTFVDEHLDKMSKEQIDMYDDLINGVTNDWDIYYWATDNKPTPPEYDNEIMRMLKMHVKNENRKSRVRQPDLKF